MLKSYDLANKSREGIFYGLFFPDFATLATKFQARNPLKGNTKSEFNFPQFPFKTFAITILTNFAEI